VSGNRFVFDGLEELAPQARALQASSQGEGLAHRGSGDERRRGIRDQRQLRQRVRHLVDAMSSEVTNGQFRVSVRDREERIKARKYLRARYAGAAHHHQERRIKHDDRSNAP
jgi:hypothetical protein